MALMRPMYDPGYLARFLEGNRMGMRLEDLGTARVRTSAAVDPAKLARLAATAPHTFGIGVPAPAGPVCVRVLVETPNPTNGSRGHWAKAAALGKRQREAVALVLVGQVPPPGPWVATLTRISVGTLDPDGLQAALKRVRDVAAQFILGGTVGLYDSDERIEWVYKQARGKRGAPAVDVEIRTR
jgi:hypothetical protein